MLFRITLLLLSCQTLQAQIPDVFQSWLGCWEFHRSDTLYRECWKAESPSVFRGVGLNLLGNDTLFHEQITLSFSENRLCYAVRGAQDDPSKSVGFFCDNWKGEEYRFENLQHDFPQRIVYQKPANNRFNAYIEGLIDKETMRIDFPFQRAE